MVVGRNSECCDIVFGGIEFGRIGRYEDGGFLYGVGILGVLEDERRVERGGEELMVVWRREEIGGGGYSVRRKNIKGVVRGY